MCSHPFGNSKKWKPHVLVDLNLYNNWYYINLGVLKACETKLKSVCDPVQTESQNVLVCRFNKHSWSWSHSSFCFCSKQFIHGNMKWKISLSETGCVCHVKWNGWCSIDSKDALVFIVCLLQINPPQHWNPMSDVMWLSTMGLSKQCYHSHKDIQHRNSPIGPSHLCQPRYIWPLSFQTFYICALTKWLLTMSLYTS